MGLNSMLNTAATIAPATRTTGSRNQDVYTFNAGNEFATVCQVMPMSETELRDNRNDRVSTHRIVLPINISLDSRDRIRISGQTYEITGINRYTGSLLKRTEATAKRIG